MIFRRYTSAKSLETEADRRAYTLSIKYQKPRSLIRKLGYSALIFCLGATSFYGINVYNRVVMKEDKGVLEIMADDLSSVKDSLTNLVKGGK